VLPAALWRDELDALRFKTTRGSLSGHCPFQSRARDFRIIIFITLGYIWCGQAEHHGRLRRSKSILGPIDSCGLFSATGAFRLPQQVAVRSRAGSKPEISAVSRFPRTACENHLDIFQFRVRKRTRHCPEVCRGIGMWGHENLIEIYPIRHRLTDPRLRTIYRAVERTRGCSLIASLHPSP